MDSIENDTYGFKCLFTETHKSFPIHFGLLGVGEVKFSKFIVTYLHCTKYNEIKYFIQLYKNMFHMQDHTKISDISWVILGIVWICILYCISQFVSIILNFIALCDMYTV